MKMILKPYNKFLHHGLFPLAEVAREDMLTGLTYEIEIESYVMLRSDERTQHLASHKEVADVGA